ncbi:MAG: hypothetical protein NVS9B4_00910 [Candidatus Acidiferrum sp.]
MPLVPKAAADTGRDPVPHTGSVIAFVVRTSGKLNVSGTSKAAMVELAADPSPNVVIAVAPVPVKAVMSAFTEAINAVPVEDTSPAAGYVVVPVYGRQWFVVSQ